MLGDAFYIFIVPFLTVVPFLNNYSAKVGIMLYIVHKFTQMVVFW